MRPPVGLVPAAGRAKRLGLAGRSKETVSISATAGASRPVITYLLDVMGEAGIERAWVVIRSGKWDIPAALERRSGSESPHLAYIVTPGTNSIPETLDCAELFLAAEEVVLGFPDVRFSPRGALADLVATHRETGSDVTLALFPSERPDKTDMVETDGGRVTGFRIKPGPCELTHTWLLAAWGPRFTRFLHDFLARSREQRLGRIGELQISEVMEAALEAGLAIGAHLVDGGEFIDIGTPEDLERASVEPERAEPP